MDPVKAEHLAFIKAHGRFTVTCDPKDLRPEQLQLLQRWGHWYAALNSGMLKPFTAAQRAFITASQQDLPPGEVHAHTWWYHNLLTRQRARARQRMERTANGDTITYDTW